MNINSHLYFAYGSNLNKTQMKKRCQTSKLIDVGYLKDYKLVFSYYSSTWNGGVADIIPENGTIVWGLIYTLTEQDLTRLDKYEGYPDIYTRFHTSIRTIKDTILNAWVYTVIKKTSFMPPTKGYLENIKIAAREYNFPKNYCKFLDNIITENNK
jgi:gamma-glutamylcyclotransferase (GGCT)/AIG2-like uncharacterized protein YtfP